MNHYSYRVVWSPEDEEYVGTCLEFPSLSHLDEDPTEALKGIADLVAFVVEDMTSSGEPVPAPLSERTYTGKFMVRTSPDLHRQLTIEATERGVSINKWANEKLARSDVLVQPAARSVQGSAKVTVARRRPGRST